ncbi:MAG: ATP-dependent sacrificial sulfur transferase LarE [Candidatus Heimdallarchaeota archaeon]|nr:ATP-dependent sacrificial sulfur transferase LarE [Candidatus Heimdallarchaeota archaeon]
MLETKLRNLKKLLKKYGTVIIAYSGGVDSTFLAKVSQDVLGENAIAVTIATATLPKTELIDAEKFAKEIGIQHFIIDDPNLNTSWFADNPKERCYICKKNMIRTIREFCYEKGLKGELIEGSNLDDLKDFRPGFKAIKELGVKSPLIEAELTKKDIRKLSKQFGLPSWNKSPMPCLATRFPFGTSITKEQLARIDEAESIIRALGLVNVRVRVHENNVVRIETAKDQLRLVVEQAQQITEQLKALGFRFITLDLEGYQMGSMNL